MSAVMSARHKIHYATMFKINYCSKCLAHIAVSITRPWRCALQTGSPGEYFVQQGAEAFPTKEGIVN